MRTLRRYVSRQVFGSTLLVFLALLMLFSFFDFISWNSYRILVKFRLMLSLGRSPPLLTLYPLTMQLVSL